MNGVTIMRAGTETSPATSLVATTAPVDAATRQITDHESLTRYEKVAYGDSSQSFLPPICGRSQVAEKPHDAFMPPENRSVGQANSGPVTYS